MSQSSHVSHSAPGTNEQAVPKTLETGDGARTLAGQDYLASTRDFVRDFLSFAGTRVWPGSILIVIAALLEWAGLLLLVPVLSAVIEANPGGGWIQEFGETLSGIFGADTRFERLLVLLSIIVGLMILRGIALSYRDLSLGKLRLDFTESRRLRLVEKLAAAPWLRLARMRHARIGHVLSADMKAIGDATYFMIAAVISAAALLFQCVLAFFLSPWLALLALAITAAGLAVLAPTLRHAHRVGVHGTGTELLLMNNAVQFMGGLKVAVSQNLQKTFVAEFASLLRELNERYLALIRQRTFSQIAFTTGPALAGVIVVIVGVGFMEVAPSMLIALIVVLGRMSGPASQIQHSANFFVNALAGYDSARALESELADIRVIDVDETPVAEVLPGPIVLQDVSYLHQAAGDTNGGVRNIGMTIQRGSIVGLTGPSGGGKTTLADLIVGLLEPQSGDIRVGALPLRGKTLASWRSQVGYAPQDPFLFTDTIRKNLAWAKEDASEEDMWTALALAGADEIVRNMPLGLDQVMGERGSLISGGERQRLALARALLRKPSLLILDEAMAALDVEAERAILQRLRLIIPRSTIIIIAHRAEGLAICDRIVVMNGGRATETAATSLRHPPIP